MLSLWKSCYYFNFNKITVSNVQAVCNSKVYLMYFQYWWRMWSQSSCIIISVYIHVCRNNENWTQNIKEVWILFISTLLFLYIDVILKIMLKGSISEDEENFYYIFASITYFCLYVYQEIQMNESWNMFL